MKNEKRKIKKNGDWNWRMKNGKRKIKNKK